MKYLKSLSKILCTLSILIVSFSIANIASASLTFKVHNLAGEQVKVTLTHFSPEGEEAPEEIYAKYYEQFKNTARDYARRKGTGVYTLTQDCGNYNVIKVKLPQDKCHNIDGTQKIIPYKQIRFSNGNCGEGIKICPDGTLPPASGICGECKADVWTCGEWGSCINGSKSRTCELTFNCPNADTPKPPTTQSCDGGPGDTGSCTEDKWNCSDWSNCVNGFKSRSCSKSTVGSSCPTTHANRPAEVMSCGGSGNLPPGSDPSCPYPKLDGSCKPKVEFEAIPQIINKGSSCNLLWDVNNAANCKITGPSIDLSFGCQGNCKDDISVTPDETSTYNLTCFNGPTNSSSDDATCKVQDIEEN